MLPMTLNLTELVSVSDKLRVYLPAQNRFLLTATPAIDTVTGQWTAKKELSKNIKVTYFLLNPRTLLNPVQMNTASTLQVITAVYVHNSCISGLLLLT